MNTKLLNKVANAILDEPRMFDMGAWVNQNANSPCGTTACIAGFAVAIDRKYKRLRSLQILDSRDLIEDVAMKTLDIGSVARHRLFHRPNWPGIFKDASFAAKSREEAADIAFWRIQHFIATEGQE